MKKRASILEAKPRLCNLITLHYNEGLTTCVKDINEWKEKSSYGRKSRGIFTRRVDRQSRCAFATEWGSKGNINEEWRLVAIEVFFGFGLPFLSWVAFLFWGFFFWTTFVSSPLPISIFPSSLGVFPPFNIWFFLLFFLWFYLCFRAPSFL